MNVIRTHTAGNSNVMTDRYLHISNTEYGYLNIQMIRLKKDMVPRCKFAEKCIIYYLELQSGFNRELRVKAGTLGAAKNQDELY